MSKSFELDPQAYVNAPYGQFDKEKEFDELLLPLLDQVRDLCVKHEIPYFFLGQYSNETAGASGLFMSSEAFDIHATAMPILAAQFLKDPSQLETVVRLIELAGQRAMVQSLKRMARSAGEVNGALDA